MKKLTFLKSTKSTVALLAGLLLILGACNNEPKLEDTKDIAEEHNEAKFDNTKNEKDAQFLVNAAEINLEEIQLGKLAQLNSKRTIVVDLGKMMVSAHTQSLNDLTTLAINKTITLPTAITDKALETYNKLSTKSGTAFDKEYCDMMVNGHKDAIAIFEKASTDANDGDIKLWATNTLPALRMHLDAAITCKKKCESMK